MLAFVWAGGAMAQDRAWVQVEALPSLAEAQARARAYAEVLADVEGYQLGSRWYGLALGPYDRPGAEAALRRLRAAGQIPRDSFVSDGTNFRQQFWPEATPAASEAVSEPAAEVAPTAEAEPAATAETAVAAAAEPAPEPEETLAEARRSEAALSREDRMDLQRALQWQGFYTAAIDGAFGAGTRRSMSAWQEAMSFEPTGVLTTRQRAILIANWQADLAEFGFETVNETEAGIEISLPLGLVSFDHYEPPFVHFAEKNSSGLRVILISQPGDQSALYGLYDILQTLTIVPMEGERSRNERSFEINGTSPTLSSYARAQLSQGLIKGFILVWDPQNAARAERVLGQMKASFNPVGNRALDPGMIPMTEGARKGLMAGLEMRRPLFSRSGFYVDPSGRVVTALSAVAQCGRITLDSVTEAEVASTDAATGVAVLKPKITLAPPAVAALQGVPDRIGAEIAVAGYSYEDALPAPVMTYGTLDDTKGLDGEPGLKRLGITTLPGDAGGPVLDGTGAVLGMLLPRAEGGARVLPEGVEFAVSAATLAEVLKAAGVKTTDATPEGALAPEDLTRRAMDLTVLVGCWE